MPRHHPADRLVDRLVDSRNAPATFRTGLRSVGPHLQRLQQVAAAMVIALLLAGCASTMTAQVTSFHQLPNGLQGQRFVIMPSAEQRDSLEFESYAGLVREALARKGLIDARDTPGTADLGVTLDYEVAGRSAGVRNGTSGFAGFGAGSGGFSRGSVGIGIGFPIGSFGGGSDSVVYQRSLAIAISRLNDRAGTAAAEATAGSSAGAGAAGTARIFEARAISEGSSASLAPVMPAMVQAIFEEFPGPNGQTRVVQVPLDAAR